MSKLLIWAAAMALITMLVSTVAFGAADPAKSELSPFLDTITLGATSKPTLIRRGVVGGLSFPIWSAGPNANEQIFFQVIVPFQWDEESNLEVDLAVTIDTANVDNNFQLEIAWEHTSPQFDLLPDTNHIATVEINTGNAAQWQTFTMMFDIDFTVDSPDDIIIEDIMSFRLRRIAATSDEIAGEVIVNHIGVHVTRGDQDGLLSEADVEQFALVMIPLALTVAYAISRQRMLAWMSGGAWAVVGGNLMSVAATTWDANFTMGFLAMLGFGGGMILEAALWEPRRRRGAAADSPDDEEIIRNEELSDDAPPVPLKRSRRRAKQSKDDNDFETKGTIRQ